MRSLQKPFSSCLWHFFHPSACPLSCSSSRIISHSLLPSLSLSPLSYFSICLILARPLTHKSNTGHLNTICLLPMESRMGWRESRRGSIAPRTVSPLTRFHIHLPIAPSFPPIPPHSLFSCFVPNPIEWRLPICWHSSSIYTWILAWPTGVSQILLESPPFHGCGVWVPQQHQEQCCPAQFAPW